MTQKISAVFLCFLALLLCLAACTTIAKPDETEPDVALMEFPGLKWNSSIEEVKKALNLKEDQILDDKLGAYEQDYDHEIWNLLVKDVTFLGAKAEIAHFMFVRYPGNDFGLMSIDLSFSEDIDMNAVKNNMITVYGAGSEASAQSYSINEKGELVETDTKSQPLIPYRESGFPHYWYSTKTGKELLSKAAQERYVSYYLSANPNINPATFQASLLDKLELTPLVSVCCIDGKKQSTEKVAMVSFAANQWVHNIQQFE